jgi:hypothetical protein
MLVYSFKYAFSLSTVLSRACLLLIALCLFIETFVRLVLLVLPVYVRHFLAYKNPLGMLPRFIKCLVV